MQHRRMAYRDEVPNDCGESSLRYVNDRAVLDVCAFPDSNVVAIAAQHAVEPDAGVRPDLDVADDLRALFDKRGVGDPWADAFV